jgi:hypothetical protein
MGIQEFVILDFLSHRHVILYYFGLYSPLEPWLGRRSSTNAFLKTTVRKNVSELDFIVHYLHVSAPISGHLQVKCTQNIY